VSELIKHECGIGLIRLFKPLEYYQQKYGSALWGLRKMYLLMEKQRNRGQDGAGLGVVKLNSKPGRPYMHRVRDNETNPWTNIFHRVDTDLLEYQKLFPDNHQQAEILKQHYDWAGEVMLGHLRYGTHGTYGTEACHPVRRSSEYQTRSLLLAGNFNLTNVDYLFQKLVELGQHPRYHTDTETVLERIGHFLDVAHDHLVSKYLKEGYSSAEVTQLISADLNPIKIMKNAATSWDGGYVIGGIIGNGDAFVVRDPNGIRPCFYHLNDEFFVAASEMATLSTVFNLPPSEIEELAPGHIVSIKANNNKVKIKPFTEAGEKLSCSFERIYFSRGSDGEIYKERKKLGEYIVPKVLDAIDHDLDHAVFSFIPNTSESAFFGMMQGLEDELNVKKIELIKKLGSKPDKDKLKRIIDMRPRAEKIIIKDVKMRTFIADDNSRDDLVSHVYDITTQTIEAGVDSLVAIDDSIVRGTTLRKSIINILARLKPKKIVIVSSAPQIRYPDCYGIDMSQIEKLIAFQAAIALLKDAGQADVLDRVYQKIIGMKQEGRIHERNVVKEIYDPFTEDQVSKKISELLSPPSLKSELEIVYQPLSNLSKAIPNHLGDWYFSGDYPTPGGNRVVNQAYLNFYEGKNERAYQMSIV
jgi:amidophosphoribosyltransferase